MLLELGSFETRAASLRGWGSSSLGNAKSKIEEVHELYGKLQALAT